MMGAVTALQTAVDATIGRLRALDESERLQRERWQAYAQMADEGRSHRQISEDLVISLMANGLTSAEIRRAGVSHDSITNALARLRG